MLKSKKKNNTFLGIALSYGAIELTSFNPSTQKIEVTAAVELTPGELNDENALIGKCQALFSQVTIPVKEAHLTVPGALLRLIEMPKMPDKELYMALSSEAERYKIFDDTEAVVDFSVLPPTEQSAPNSQQVVFGALREDHLSLWMSVFQTLKIRIVSVSNNLLNVHRAMAGSGVLDGLLQQAGQDAYWGVVYRGKSHVWFVLWQGNTLVELREVNMQMAGLESAEPDVQAMIYGDLSDEMVRTAKHAPSVAVWLTHGFNDQQNAILAEKTSLSVRSAFAGPVFEYESYASIPAIGVAMTSVVEYPFEFNYLAGSSKLSKGGASGGKSAKGSSGAPEPESASVLPNILMGLGIVVMLLCVVAWAGISAYDNMVVGKQLTEAEQLKSQKTQEKSRLDSEIQSLSNKQGQQLAVLNLMRKVKHRDSLYPQFFADLIQVTPSDVWVYDATLGNQFSVKGKGISHESVILFARKFDPLKFVKNVTIEQVLEEVTNDRQVRFDFEIKGQPQLTPTKR